MRNGSRGRRGGLAPCGGIASGRRGAEEALGGGWELVTPVLCGSSLMSTLGMARHCWREGTRAASVGWCGQGGPRLAPAADMIVVCSRLDTVSARTPERPQLSLSPYPVSRAARQPHGCPVPGSDASQAPPHTLPWEQLIRYMGTSFKMIFNTARKTLKTY